MSNDQTAVVAHKPRSYPPLAIISDIHSNLPALAAVLADIATRGVKRIVCLGDVVGYGPDPAECWRLVRKTCDLLIRGNHDHAVVGGAAERFHPRAKTAIEWTRKCLLEQDDGEDILRDMAALPYSIREGDYYFVHGSPAGVTMSYLLPGDAFDKDRMKREFDNVDVYAFNGHTHIPGVIQRGESFAPPEALADGCYPLTGRQAIINVGSVGQPRDGNPKSCYVTIEDGVLSYHRVAYDTESVCERILAIPELDSFLGRRLLAGY